MMNKVLNAACVFSYHMPLSFRLAVYIFTTLICQGKEREGGGYFTIFLHFFILFCYIFYPTSIATISQSRHYQ